MQFFYKKNEMNFFFFWQYCKLQSLIKNRVFSLINLNKIWLFYKLLVVLKNYVCCKLQAKA